MSRPRMLFVTIMRHGESTDNLKSLWSGHKDAPLSNHGMAQAKAAGEALKSTPFSKVYCSDLKRAHWTAQRVLEANSHLNSTSVPESSKREVTHQVLREQFFGDAEGMGWHQATGLEEDYGDRRKNQFRNGESLEDVARRADTVVNAIIKPWLIVTQSKEEDVHILLVAHGIMNAELVRSFLLLNQNTTEVYGLGPLNNTAYHSLRFHLLPEALPLSPALIQQAEAITNATEFPEAVDSFKSLELPIKVSVVMRGQDSHLRNVKRQKGGIGSSPYDERQQTIRNFFGGGGAVQQAPRHEGDL